MTALEYLKAKNDLVKRVTGHLLIPEDQLVEHEPDMTKFEPRLVLSELNCTYCTLYYDENCNRCPMKEASNGCIDYLGTSYSKTRYTWEEKATEEDKEEMYRLGEQFQKEYKEK